MERKRNLPEEFDPNDNTIIDISHREFNKMSFPYAVLKENKKDKLIHKCWTFKTATVSNYWISKLDKPGSGSVSISWNKNHPYTKVVVKFFKEITEFVNNMSENQKRTLGMIAEKKLKNGEYPHPHVIENPLREKDDKYMIYANVTLQAVKNPKSNGTIPATRITHIAKKNGKVETKDLDIIKLDSTGFEGSIGQLAFELTGKKDTSGIAAIHFTIKMFSAVSQKLITNKRNFDEDLINEAIESAIDEEEDDTIDVNQLVVDKEAKKASSVDDLSVSAEDLPRFSNPRDRMDDQNDDNYKTKKGKIKNVDINNFNSGYVKK